jgi:hypothetical protein
MSKRPGKPWYQSTTILYNTLMSVFALIACGCAETQQEGNLFLSAFIICVSNIAFRLFATTNIE